MPSPTRYLLVQVQRYLVVKKKSKEFTIKKHRFGASIVDFEQVNSHWEVTYVVFRNSKPIP